MSIKKEELDLVNYTLGIISIVLAFFQPLAGFIFGVFGFIKSKDSKTELGKKAKKFNLIGLILSAVIFVITTIVTIKYLSTGIFPVG
jgi:hypothetical protein